MPCLACLRLWVQSSALRNKALWIWSRFPTPVPYVYCRLHIPVWSQNALSNGSFEDHGRAEAQDLGSNPWFTAWEIWRYFPAPWIKKFWPTKKHRIKIPVWPDPSALNPVNNHVEALEHGPVGSGSTFSQLVAPALGMRWHRLCIELG